MENVMPTPKPAEGLTLELVDKICKSAIAPQKKALAVVTFCSRHKDNDNVDGFKPRCQAFPVYLNPIDIETLQSKFQKFCNEGLPNEVSRFYITLNARYEDGVRSDLICRILQNETNFSLMNRVITSVAARCNDLVTKCWMFDVDGDDMTQQSIEFAVMMYTQNQQLASGVRQAAALYKTKSGCHVITSAHFDTRKIEQYYSQATLKRNADCLAAYGTADNVVYTKARRLI